MWKDSIVLLLLLQIWLIVLLEIIVQQVLQAQHNALQEHLEMWFKVHKYQIVGLVYLASTASLEAQLLQDFAILDIIANNLLYQQPLQILLLTLVLAQQDIIVR